LHKIPNLRWWIAGLLATAGALAYGDRQTLPVAIHEIQKTIPVSDAQYAHLQFLFLLAYGFMYAGGGKIADLLGARWGYVLFIVWWSAANFMQGTVTGLAGLSIALFMLGGGEGGCFPAAAKAISEWFPASERSLAFGMFNGGASFGATIAPPLIALIVLKLGWRWVFFVTAAVGFAWAAVWLLFYHDPARHKLITAGEAFYLETELRGGRISSSRISWKGLFRIRQFWGLFLAKLLTDSAWFFLILWLPKYLYDARHLDIRAIGYYAWIPYAWSALGGFSGGWLSSYLIRRHVSLDKSRKVCLAISAACMPVSLLITLSPLSLTIVFFSLAMLGHQFWSTILYTLVIDMYPPAVVGSIAGVLGAVGSFGGMLFSLIAGAILTRFHSYLPIFLILGLLHPLSLAIILLLVRRIEPLAGPRLTAQKATPA
jgi:ACS family hexuronate transporter-like MFS transporter